MPPAARKKPLVVSYPTLTDYYQTALGTLDEIALRAEADAYKLPHNYWPPPVVLDRLAAVKAFHMTRRLEKKP